MVRASPIRPNKPHYFSCSFRPDLRQGRAFMHGDVIGLVAFDFILRLIPAGMTRMALVVGIFGMDLDNPAADVPGLGIPRDVIALFEAFCHLALTRKHAGCSVAGQRGLGCRASAIS